MVLPAVRAAVARSLVLPFAPLVLALSASPSYATLYEDGGGGANWQVLDATPDGASVGSVDDEVFGEPVVETSGEGRANAYLLGGTTDAGGWNNVDEHHASFRLRTTESFTVYFLLDTRDGWRRLAYSQSNRDSLGGATARTVHHGLGSRARDGRWRVFGRDLAADLADAQPDNELLAVNGFLVRGDVRVDEVALGDERVPERVLPRLSPDVDLDAEDGDASVWAVFDARPAGASASVVPGEGRAGRVYALAGEGRSNGFRVGGQDATEGWNNVEQRVLTWAMRSAGSYRVSVRIDTANGPRRLNYDPRGGDSLGHPNGRDIGFGLGRETTDDTWRPYARDLAADLARAEPDNRIEAVQGLDVRGELRVDDIRLVDELPAPPDTTPLDTTPPTAAFEAMSADGDEPLAIAFDASASSDDTGIVAWRWDFGDGGEGASGERVEHVYATPGTRTVTLKVADAAGLEGTSTLDVTVEADGGPGDGGEGDSPVAVATIDVTSGAAPLAVTFDGSASTTSGAVEDVTHVWTFDDGSEPLEGVVVTRTFETEGVVVATLTVTDGAGRSASAGASLTVTPGSDGGGGGDGGGSGGGPITAADRDAARLLAQATFGATAADIARVRELGIEGWIDDQLGREGPAHLEYVRANSNGSSREARHDVWWRDAIGGEDQLRQRVAFALSQIFVVSDTGYTLGNAQYGVTGYYDVLRGHAFGRYRELLEDVTLHPVMGIYLSMLQNDKGDPFGNTRADENFAREVLQLFSIGPHALNADGATRTNGSKPVPSFTQDDVESYARAFTGWNFASATRWDFPVLRTDADKVRPMTPDEAHHDTEPKALLGGVTTPAGASAREDLRLALDSIANHPNVGPFISAQLIRRLVTSNPTPGYVRRVAGVFDDDGRGARGNLGAVVRAILLDAEARGGHETVTDFGKLREPVLRISHLWRAFGARPGTQGTGGNFNTKSPHAKDLDTLIGQAVLKSPSVFNFYRPEHAPVGEIRDAGRVAPEAELYTDGHILATTTRVNSHVQLHHDLSDANSLKSTYVDLSAERALLATGGADALLERLDLLLLSGGMGEGLRDVLREHVQGFPETEAGRSQAVRDAISLIVASPAYLVQL